MEHEELTTFSEQRLLFVVEKNNDNPQHHYGLAENHSRHLLTMRPGPGDKIVRVIDLLVDRSAVDGSVVGAYTSRQDFTLVTHVGRSARLGEDSLEHTEEDALAVLVPEILDGAKWRLAPVEYTALTPNDDGIFALPTSARLKQYLFDRTAHGWKVS